MNKEEIEKYIFDPNNPNKCKAYKLLVKIAKQKPTVFFSPDILRYLLDNNKYLSNAIKKELWDIPKNYDKLSLLEKFKLYKKQYSLKELKEFIEKLLDNEQLLFKIFKYSFIENFLDITVDFGGELYCKLDNKNNYTSKINELILQDDSSLSRLNIYGDDLEHSIFFTNELFNILQLSIEKSSIVVTLLKNAETFYKENKNSNIKPIFLQKIEDLDLLLNVLERDLNQENTNKKENISLIKNFSIKNFYSIKDINIDLNGKKEVYIVGENGDGKTLLLQAITIGLVGVNEGEVFDLVKSQKDFKVEVEDTKENLYTKENGGYNYLLAYGASRYSYCQIKEDKSGYLSLFSSSYDLTDPVEWLKYLDHKEKSSKDSAISVNTIKNILTDILNKEIDISVSADNVEFIEKGSSVTFEQLSSGYRGVITIVCDIIARFSQKEPNIQNISEFGGVVLIDEVDLHLHPKWQYSFIRKLRNIFPKIQFIVTTHSPTVILGSSVDAVYYQTYKVNGNIKISEQKDVKNNFLNDIQSYVFGFDVNKERINNPSKDEELRQQRAKEAMLNLISSSKDR